MFWFVSLYDYMCKRINRRSLQDSVQYVSFCTADSRQQGATELKKESKKGKDEPWSRCCLELYCLEPEHICNGALFLCYIKRRFPACYIIQSKTVRPCPKRDAPHYVGHRSRNVTLHVGHFHTETPEQAVSFLSFSFKFRFYRTSDMIRYAILKKNLQNHNAALVHINRETEWKKNDQAKNTATFHSR